MLLLRSRLPLALLAASAVLGLGACGDDGAAGTDPASVVPERAVLYLEATVRPEGELKDDVETVAGTLAETEDPGGELKELINREAKEDDPDFSFDEDVEPWLGERAAVFFTALRAEDPDGAIVAAVTDTDAAQEWISSELRSEDGEGGEPKVVKRTYKDVEYEVETNENEAGAIVEDFAVFGSEAGIKAAIDAADGSTLSDAEQFGDAREQVGDEGLAFGYTRVSQLFSGLGPQGAVARQVFSGLGDTVTFSLGVEEDAIRVESAAMGVEGEATGPGEMFGELPGTAWLAAGSADVGGQFERMLEQFGQLGALGGIDLEQALGQIEQQTGLDVRQDLLSWMGDAGLFLSGSSPFELGGGLVVRSSDPDLTREALPKLERLVTQFGGLQSRPLTEGVDAGFTLQAQQLPLPIHVGLAGDRFIIAVTDRALEQAISPDGRLADAQAFEDASGKLEEGMKPSLFVDMAPVRELLDASGAIEGPEGEKARRVLEHFTTIISGSRRDGEVQRGEAVAGVK